MTKKDFAGGLNSLLEGKRGNTKGGKQTKGKGYKEAGAKRPPGCRKRTKARGNKGYSHFK